VLRKDQHLPVPDGGGLQQFHNLRGDVENVDSLSGFEFDELMNDGHGVKVDARMDSPPDSPDRHI
jgi:hypothetical protein